MKVLVSGVAGLYGVHTVQEFVNHQSISKVYGIDDFSRGFPPEEKILSHSWGDKVEIFKHRVQELSVKEFNHLDVDVVIHLAGFNSRKESVYTPEEYFSNNEYGTFQLMQILSKTEKRPFLIYASSTEVYGEPIYTPMDENHPISPQNLYAATKLAAEQHVLAFGRCCGYPVTALRFTSTFGENQNIFGYTSVISSFIDRALRNEPLIIYGSGSQTRDFMYVKDAARGLYQAITNQSAIQGMVLNIATGVDTTICQLAALVKKLVGSTSEIIKLPCEKGEPRVASVDISWANKKMGWKPQFTLEQGLLRTIPWCKGLPSI